MVRPIEQKKRQQTLLIVLVIVIIITAFVWYLSYQKKPSLKEFISSEEQITEFYSPTEKQLEQIKLDFSVLDDTLFKSLKSHGVLPVTAGETGRENPFEPY